MELHSPLWGIYTSSLLSSAVGGFIAAVAAIRAVNKTAKLARLAGVEREDRDVRNLLAALQTELESVWELYMHQFGGALAGHDFKKAPTFELILPISSDYFLIYHSNTNKIGAIQDTGLRQLIVKTYIQLEGLVDSIRYHNGLLGDFKEVRNHMLPSLVSEQLQPSKEADAIRVQLSDYGPKLQEAQNVVKPMVHGLIFKIQARLNADTKNNAVSPP
jgi:hypothetical protein